MNNSIGILLRWREEAVGLVGDIRKMFNSVHLKEMDKHCHRFLWRNLEDDKPPDIFVIERVNMGDTPSPLKLFTRQQSVSRKKARKQLSYLRDRVKLTTLLIRDQPCVRP